ncbi:hypothetical protein HG531_000543 [Fusarium graminearum]|nr:hypothetical protein HG531_000543 [Fusarium graminearum]
MACPRQASWGGKMASSIAPSQQPQPRSTASGSSTRRLSENGIEGVTHSRPTAKCVPTNNPDSDSATVVMITANMAMKEYPPLRLVGESGHPGVANSLDRARKTSLMKLEKVVKLPQKPVASPMYIGIDFLVAKTVLPFAALLCSTLNDFIAVKPRRANVPKIAKSTRYECVYSWVRSFDGFFSSVPRAGGSGSSIVFPRRAMLLCLVDRPHVGLGDSTSSAGTDVVSFKSL